MGLESFDLVLRCKLPLTRAVECLSAMALRVRPKPTWIDAEYFEVVGPDYIVEVQVLEEGDRIRISLRSALCCSTEVVDTILTCARRLSDIAGSTVWQLWNVAPRRSFLDLASVDASDLARHAFLAKQELLFRGYGLKEVRAAAVRSDECLTYLKKDPEKGSGSEEVSG